MPNMLPMQWPHKWIWVYGLGLFVVLLFLFPLQAIAQPEKAEQSEPTQVPQKPLVTKCIVLILIDGLQNDALQKAQLPYLNDLAQAGVKVNTMHGLPPDTKQARIYSILSGASPMQHGYLHKGDSPKVDTILNIFQKNGHSVLLVDGSGDLAGLGEGETWYANDESDDEKITNILLTQMDKNLPFLAVTIFPGPQQAEEKYGHDSKEYWDALKKTDTQVGKLIQYLYQNNLYEETLIAICGITGQPPFIVKGIDFAYGATVPVVCHTDIAATLTYLQGIQLTGIHGMVLWDLLTPKNDRSLMYMLQQRVNDLGMAYTNALDEASSLEQKRLVVQEEKADLTQKQFGLERNVKEKDLQIDKLHLKMSFLKTSMMIILLLCIIGLFVQLKILKKKYLFLD